MNIRPKFILAVLPLVIAPLVLVGVISTLSARSGITAVAADLLRFKAEQLATYAQGQWDLLAANGLEATPTYVEAAQAAVESFARSLVRSPTESIFALAADGTPAMRTGELAATADEMQALAAVAAGQEAGWRTFRLGGEDRVGHLARFQPFGWTFFVTERAAAFYRAADAIVLRTAYVLAGSLAAAIVLLVLLTRFLTRPLREVAEAMGEIVATSDLSRRVQVLYGDETGRLGHTFNLMTAELEKAYARVKDFAFKAVLSQRAEKKAREDERKIRSLFEKYVPPAVIDAVFRNPESALVGEDRVLAVLFSDIRNFTRISESLTPEELVNTLNSYFTAMVDGIIIGRHGGTVDKFIGDAIMAFWGTPVKAEDDAMNSAQAGLDMLDELPRFNAAQRKRGKKEFPEIGVGIAYGVVTVGNIGTDKKMNYTVIGDMVNLASRLEGLTKRYRTPLIVSESLALHRTVKGKVPSRLLDKVLVKGRQAPSGVYELRRTLDDAQRKAWDLHATAMTLYYARKFPEAEQAFREVQSLLPGDACAQDFIRRCAAFRKSPPPASWNGVEALTEK